MKFISTAKVERPWIGLDLAQKFFKIETYADREADRITRSKLVEMK